MAMITSAIVLMYALFAICAYIPFCLGLLNMLRNKKYRFPWMAFIPVANLYCLGLLIGRITYKDKTISNPQWVLPGLVLLLIPISHIPIIKYLYGFGVYGLFLLAAYRLFTLYKRDYAVLFTALSLMPLVGGILVLMVSKYPPASID